MPDRVENRNLSEVNFHGHIEIPKFVMISPQRSM